jgi:hypothetical protein
MSIQTQIQGLTRTSVRSALRAASLPMRAAQTVAHRSGRDGEWAPVLVFEGFEANVKKVVGTVLRDDSLREEGEREEERVSKLRRAKLLDAIATDEQDEARQRFNEREEALRRRRAATSRKAGELKNSVQEQRQQAKRPLEERAEQAHDTVDEEEKAAEKLLARHERAARAARVTKERAALDQERKAIQAEERVTRLDQELRSAKQARKKTS